MALCITQVTSWGVLYYAFPVALADITADTGWSASAATAAFSTGLLTSAVAGIPVGRWLDRWGPRPVMTAGSVLGVAAAAGIATAPSFGWFLAAWVVAGLAMAALFYQAAFAALTGWYGARRVRALTVLTLVAGLASTIFAPLTNLLLGHLDWRTTYLVLAAGLGLVTIPLHGFVLTLPWRPAGAHPSAGHGSGSGAVRAVVRSPGFLLLSAALTISAFGLYAASLTLIPLLIERGFTASLAATTFGLVGAGQLLGRLGFAHLLARTTPGGRTQLVLLGAAASIALLAAVPGPEPVLVAAAVLLGAVRGAGTLLQATVVADRWGTTAYGALSGWFAAPVTAAAAVAPWAGTAIAEALDSYPAMLWILSGLVLTAACALVVSTRRGAADGHPEARAR